MGWIVDDNGTRRFTSPQAPGWKLTVYESRPDQIDVDTGANETDVTVTPDGIEVFGEQTNSYDCSAVRFTIPWAIIQEIIRFQESVQSPQ